MPRVSLLLSAVTMAVTVSASAAHAQGGFSAPGEVYVDCVAYPVAIQRLRAGLPQQDEWIRRTEQQLEQAERGRLRADRQYEETLEKSAKDLVLSQLKAAQAMRDQLNRMRGTIGDVTYENWLKVINGLDESVEPLKTFNASLEYGTQLRRNQATLENFARFLDESGIGDEAAKQLATAYFPVMGPVVVQGLIVVRDLQFAQMDANFSAAEAQTARQNLEKMKAARDAVQTRIDAYQEALDLNRAKCAAQASQQRANNGNGGGAPVKAIIAGGAAAAGGVVAWKSWQDLKASERESEQLAAETRALINSIGSSSSSSTSTSSGSTGTTTATTTYSATASYSCTPGSNSSEPCNRAVASGGCDPFNITFTVTGSTVRDACNWLIGSVSGSTFTGRYTGTASTTMPMSGTLPSAGSSTQWTGTDTYRGNSYRITVTVTRR